MPGFSSQQHRSPMQPNSPKFRGSDRYITLRHVAPYGIANLPRNSKTLFFRVPPRSARHGMVYIRYPLLCSRLTEGRSRKTSFSDEVDEYVCGPARLRWSVLPGDRNNVSFLDVVRKLLNPWLSDKPGNEWFIWLCWLHMVISWSAWQWLAGYLIAEPFPMVENKLVMSLATDS